ncbi:FAD-binding oxidoreductase [Dactylosporangium sp. NPDC005572]|uniref:FAD-binding oxidoreductase n=1 Tax=Dactylosporangium sp. NPDC005572 TaxID=3156889 RepID=UPI0033AFF3E1
MTTTTSDSVSAVDPAALAALTTRVGGPVLLPGDDAYDRGRATFNLSVQHHPALVIGATSAADVVEAVRFAGQHGLRVAVQATGHGPAEAADGALLIDTSRMAAVSIDADTRIARVEAGVRWAAVITAASAHGLAALNGSSPTVGVVGYTLGGGLSPVLGRAHGYAADHVTAFDIVTADGRLRHVTAATEPELFWAVRGGKANFGVVTAIEFRLFPLTRLYGGGLYFPGAQASQILKAWRSWVETTPDELTSSVALLRLPPIPEVPEPLRGQFVVHVRVAYLGSAGDGEQLVTPVRTAGTPVIDTLADMPYSAVAAIHNDPVEPLPIHDRSTLLQDLPAAAIDRIVALAGQDAEVPVTMVEIRHLGGALRRAPQSLNAVANRDAPFLLFAASVAGPDEAVHHVALHTRLFAALATWDTGRTFANFLAPGDNRPTHVMSAYLREDRHMLAALKQLWDPQQIFSLTHAIRPTGSRSNA